MEWDAPPLGEFSRLFYRNGSVVGDAFFGIRRFDDFQASLGIARNILTSRLSTLVDMGIMRRVQYQDRPVRHEYRLTEKGTDLVPVLTAMLAWGDKWGGAEDDPVGIIHKPCGDVMHTKTVCGSCGEGIDAFNLTIDPIPDIVKQRRERFQPVQPPNTSHGLSLPWATEPI